MASFTPAKRSERDDVYLREQANGNRSTDAMTELFDRVVRLDEVDSTNRYCADAARDGADEGLVVIANRQTAGKGRRGRHWYAPGSSAILASFLFRPTFLMEEMHLLSTIVGLSACEAVELQGVLASLKWPNDLVIGGKKVAGLLGELVDSRSADRKSAYAAVVGIGLNIAWPDGWPESESDEDIRSLSENATTVSRALGSEVEIAAVFDDLSAGVSRRYQALSLEGGRELLMGEYRSKCSTIGQRVRIELANKTIETEAVGINDSGHLVISSDGVQSAIEVGDVVHLRPSSDK